MIRIRVQIEQRPGGRVRMRFPGRSAGEDAQDADLSNLPVIVEAGRGFQESLLSAVAVHHMQTYLTLCERSGLHVELYRDDVNGELYEPGTERSRMFVRLRPRLLFKNNDTPDLRATAIRLINEALAQSVFFEAPRISIEVDPIVEFGTG